MAGNGWVPHGPEQRLSVCFNRLLGDTLMEPCYFTATQDSDHGALTEMQRKRNADRGIKYGQLDWEVWQQSQLHGFPLIRKVELKRGKNGTTDRQDVTIEKLTACGAPPIVGRELDELIDKMQKAGFKFKDNLATKLQYWSAALEGMDRTANAVKEGSAPKKRSKPVKYTPRNMMTGAQASKLRSKGIFT